MVHEGRCRLLLRADSLDAPGSHVSPRSNVNSTYFTLHWNVMPYVGVLAYGDELSTEPLPVPKRIEGESKNEERVWY